ncbi:conserved Plasmodium protein, unknown function [Plasmodium gallinaceum]|uniref:Uncharacterized protein n=1 Tax=Plasmodium gallinaceum TaxID=5849 RepID=A0A1J1GKS3_PLAGA|nr:conserved Plasmodium protein, unknown function [Plasmodium gallinaceum]CRG92969.1 conserved Plasmodium protein, unknown function [Plasmodium gallinaceum]
MILYSNNSIILLVLFFYFFLLCKIKAGKSSLNYKTQLKINNGKNVCIKRNKDIEHKLFFLKKKKNYVFKNKNDFEKKIINILNLNYKENNNILCNINFQSKALSELIFPFNNIRKFIKCYLIDLDRVLTHKNKKIFKNENEINKVNTSTNNNKDKNDIDNNNESNDYTDVSLIKIEKYINQQLIKLTNEILTMKKNYEKKEKEMKNNNYVMKWNFYINKKSDPLKCFVYLDLPEGTIMLKPSEVDDKNFLISINALNDIRRNNKEILKNIYFKKFNITFDYIYKNCNFITLLVNKLLDQGYCINLFTIFSLLSSFYILNDSFYQCFLYLLSSEIIWNPFVYNIWCNIYHTTLPLKLFMLKQTFSYSKIAFNSLVDYIKSKLIKLETILINSSLKSKICLDTKQDNIYDKQNFKIAIDDYNKNDEEEFKYI